MSQQDFEAVASGDPSLLRQVELIVVDGHRRMYAAQRKPWSEPIAYHWLRYEDPMPVTQLARGVQELIRTRIKFDPEAVDKACAEAHKMGFPN
jgi:hypothetical protein